MRHLLHFPKNRFASSFVGWALFACSSLFILHSSFAAARPADIYLVFYATVEGTTGHVGIAVDTYDILLREEWKMENAECRIGNAHCPENLQEAGMMDSVRVIRHDTLHRGDLVYFDLWPKQNLRFGEHGRDMPARYFKLPGSSSEAPITAESLLEKGLPHRDRYPCDGLLRIRTQPWEDQQMLAAIEAVITQNPEYNTRRFNCADFVRACMEVFSGQRIRAREFIPFSWSTTPNKLYRKLARCERVETVRDPGKAVNGSFLWQRVFKKSKS